MTVKELKEKLDQFDENLPVNFIADITAHTMPEDGSEIAVDECEITIREIKDYSYTYDVIGEDNYIEDEVEVKLGHVLNFLVSGDYGKFLEE